MEQVEFFEEIRSLEAFFEKKLSIEQARDWYYELKDYSIEKLRVAIRESKTNCKFMPKLAEFLEFIRAVRIEEKETEKIKCDKCGGSGYLIYIKKIVNGGKVMNYTYGCVCNCGNAKPYYDKKKKYYTETENEILSSGYDVVTRDRSGKKIFIGYEQDLW